MVCDDKRMKAGNACNPGTIELSRKNWTCAKLNQGCCEIRSAHARTDMSSDCAISESLACQMLLYVASYLETIS